MGGGRTGPPAIAPAIRPYLVVAAVVVVASLAGFAAAEALQVPVFTDPSTVLDGSGAVAAAASGTALLVGDVVAPVPSSLVMVTHGVLFGPVARRRLGRDGPGP